MVGPTKVYLSVTGIDPRPGMAPAVVIWRKPRVVTRLPPATPGPVVPDAALLGLPGALGPILKTESLRSVLTVDEAAALAFGVSPDKTAMGPDDFATTGATSFTIEVPAGGNVVEFQAEAELGKDRSAVVRVLVSDRPEGSARDPRLRVLLADPKGAGYRRFRAGIDEYVALLPPASHGEVNPADKDPVPRPFDNTYNSREHDAFVLQVKYQRNDRFFTENVVDGADRTRLNQAWTDLFGSWPYHDAYLGMLADHFELKLEEPPDPGPGRGPNRGLAPGGPAVPHGATGSLRRSDGGAAARAARPHRGRDPFREPRVATPADRGREGRPPRVLPEVA